MLREENRVQVRLVLSLTGVISVFVLLVYFSAPHSGSFLLGDFSVFYEAAQRLRRGEPIYIRGGMAYMNPPFFAWMLQPFTCVPESLGRRIWTVIMYGLVLVSCRLLLGGSEATPHRRAFLWGAMLSVPVLIGNLFLGQNVALVLFALVSGYVLQKRGHHVLAGIILALGLIKPHFLIGPVIVLLAARRWRELIGLAGAAIILGVISLLVVDGEGILGYLQVTGDAVGWVKAGDYWRTDLHTPNGVLHQFVPYGVADIAVMLVGAVVIALIVWRCSRDREVSSQTFSLGVVGALLITPYAHLHDLMLLIIPWLLLGEVLRGWRWWVLIASYLAPVAHVVLLGIGGYGPVVTVPAITGLFVYLT